MLHANSDPISVGNLLKFPSHGNPFSADGIGLITKDEVMAMITALIKLADGAYQHLPIMNPMRDQRQSRIVDGVFRIFDSNGNWIIKTFELNEIVSDVIYGIAGIISTVIDYCEQLFLKIN